MCGIVGLWNLDGRPVDPCAFDRFVDSIKHRGPDGRGTYINAQCCLALGHRLLAIQGHPGEGKQPRALDSRYWITFNGEIYNFIELRGELEGFGHTFQTGTDTEVILAAYAQWGEQCLHRFNGMWAFAIWDTYERKLFLAVDRFAVKSMLYIASSRYFAFASEIKAFPYLDRFAYVPDSTEISRILHVGEGDNVATWLTNVRRLPAGHSLTISETRPPLLKQWWNTFDHIPQHAPRGCRATEHFAELFDSAVSLRLRSTARIAVPLSGGMDSSSVLASALISQASPTAKGLRCFFVRKHGELDEERYARSMAAYTNSDLVTIEGAKSLDVETMLKTVVAYEKFVPSSDGPLRLYKAISESGAKVSLDGHGGDELLGGYSCYIEQALDDALRGFPNLYRVAELARINRLYSVGSEQFSILDGWAGTRRRLKEALKRRRNNTNGFALTGVDDFDSLKKELPPWFDSLNRELYRDVHFGFLQKILRTFDYASMAYGVEARTPFLDWRVVTFLFSLPATYKIGKSYSKSILRSAMRGRMPDDVRLRRSKIGFIENRPYFFNDSTIAWIGDVIASSSFQSAPYWNANQIRGVFDRWNKNREQVVVARRLLSVAQACFLIEEFRGYARQSVGSDVHEFSLQ